MKKNISKIVSITMSSLFILSSTVALGMIGYKPENVVQAPLSSVEEAIKEQENIGSVKSQIASAETKDESLTNSTAAESSIEENSSPFAAASNTDTAGAVVEEAPKTALTSDSAKNAATFSRGGINPYSYGKDSNNTASAAKSNSEQNVATESKKKVEVLDWWKSASSVFAIGSVATVKDVYTGKTFKVKRTMGTNHSDTEALTLEDTEIIKSIWGGFSWERRPIHIYINGRVLAASMSAMPHAGIDSAPAYAYVENRSQGYGAGSNLDVVKNNDMDGHFDIHFLNSTRHKDGQPDPQHQAAIKVAASK